uniref:Serine/threonine-protein kinase ATR n=1 Tax=Syphacia muris TaxID=451379 RepID=A0A0N5AZ30_9BILA
MAGSENEVYMLCKVIAYEYRDEVRLKAAHGQDLTHLKDLPQLFLNYFTRYSSSFSSDIIIWTVARFLSLLSCPAVYDKLGGLYRQQLLSMMKFLDENSKKFFFEQIVLSLFETMIESRSLVIKINDSNGSTPREVRCRLGSIVLFDVTIPLSGTFEKRAPLQLCLLDLIQHGCFELSWLGAVLLNKTWLLLIRMGLICDMAVKSKVFLVIQRLLTLDLCNTTYAELLLSLFISSERQLLSEVSDAELVCLQESLNTCEQTFGRNLRKFENFQMFKGLTVSRCLEWLNELFTYFQNHSCYEARIVHLIADHCSVLARAKNVTPTQFLFLEKTGERVSAFVCWIFDNDITICNEELGDLFSFMLNVDACLKRVDLQNKIISLGSLAKDRGKNISVLKAVRRQHIITSALKNTCNGVSVLSHVIPQSQELMQILNFALNESSDTEEVVLSLIKLISTLVDCCETDQPTWLAFLSFPWLVEPIDISRHKASIPLLTEIRKLAKNDAFAQSLTVEMKMNTIAALSKMQFGSEWRRILFTHALDSGSVSLQRTALENFPYFVASIDTYAYKYLLDKILFIAKDSVRLNEDSGLCATAFKAVANSICTLDTKVTLKADEICAICSQKSNTQQKMFVDLKNFFTLLENGFVHPDKDIRLACCAALQASLKHVRFHSSNQIEEFIQKSLILMRDVDEDVRLEYEWCLIQIVQMQWDNLPKVIGARLSELENIGSRNVQLQYTVICAEYATDEYLSSMCFLRLILQALTPDASEEAIITCESLIKANIAGSLDIKLTTDLNVIFNVLAHLFGYVNSTTGTISIRSLLRDICTEFIPFMILTSESLTQSVKEILYRIMEIRKMTSELLITECFASLLVHLLDKNITTLRLAFRFIEEFTNGSCNWRDLMVRKVYDCTVCLLQNLSVSEERCMQQLKALYGVVHGDETNFSLTALVEERYLGILLRFRPSFSDDRYYLKRNMLVSSLCKMMRIIKKEGTSLLDNTAQKTLAVLRAATQLGEVSIAAFLTFVETLSDETLVELLPRILVSITPLLKYEKTSAVLRFIFENKGLQLAANENFERISTVMWNNPKISINAFLQGNNEYIRPIRVLYACVSLLEEGCEEVCELVLHKILQVLNSSTLHYGNIGNTDDLGGILIPSLFRTIRKCNNVECRNLACLILGRLSAIDPGRIGLSVTETGHVDRRSQALVFVDSGTKFFVELLEKAAIAFAGIMDATTQEECSYSIQMTLRELLGRNRKECEDIWKSLSKTCAKELALFRKTNFTQLTRFTLPSFNSAIIDSAEVADCMSWMSNWYMFGAKKIRDYSLKVLFEALHGLVKADAVFARFLLPHVILEALIEDNTVLISQFENEMKAVLKKALLNDGWPKLCAHVVFSVLDSLERFIICRRQRHIPLDKLEATWRLKKWSDLDKLVVEYPKMSTWGATSASLLCCLKHRDINSFNNKITIARSRLVDALTAMTIEGSDTYTQAYKYITRLHILSEMEDAKDSLNLFNEEPVNYAQLASVLKSWQERSALVMQCTSSLEPIYAVRRGLLRLCNNDAVKNPICDYLLQSCRMSRLAGHLQIAWTFLVEAKALNVNHFDVAMEEARFLFEKGNQSEAVSILSKLLKERFADKLVQMQSLIGNKKLLLTPSLKESLRDEKKEEKANFVKVQLLLAEFSLKAGTCNFSDLYSKYVSLPWIADGSEDLYYRIAIFLDNYLYSKNENLLSDKVAQIVEAYIRVLLQGKTHLFHALPRMLTIWLDNTQKKVSQTLDYASIKRDKQGTASESDEKAITELNGKIRDAFNRLGPYTFYTAFAQLISRITHPNDEVFNTLKIILAELMVKYPHQCLWQSIAVFRSDAVKQRQRYERCRMVYELAKRKDSSGTLKVLIAHYEYIAASFIRVAEDSSPPGTHASFSQRYGFLANFLKSGETDKSVRVSEQLRQPVKPRVVVPLREMIEHVMPVAVPNSLSQFAFDLSATNDDGLNESSFRNVYIECIDEEYIVGYGNRYALMCKAKDELRKDARLMDINRMVNALLHQNSDARRRQLFVRTYNVVPLQEAGGLIEWIPYLRTYRSVLEPLMREKCDSVMTDKEWFSRWIPHATDEQKLERLRTEYFPRHPVVMAEWFCTFVSYVLISIVWHRRGFPEPCKWYAARLAFIHTSAVMSMVGFVLGLGDRHGENILIDEKSGDAFHVDFNLLFNKGEYLTVPEVVPFRLTRNIVNAFGATGVEGAFRKSCETTMNVLREKEEVLYTVLQTFVHDPLLEWMHAETRAQQIKQKSVQNTKLTVDSPAQQQAREAIEMIRSRLRGNIVSPKIYRSTLDNLPMSIEGQVEKLIQLATDKLNLARMYIGCFRAICLRMYITLVLDLGASLGL